MIEFKILAYQVNGIVNLMIEFEILAYQLNALST
jgi:hypothetical protein